MRARVLTERERDYVLAARCIGARAGRIMWLHVLPNAMAPLLIQISLSMGFAVLAESALTFLGLGTQPPHPSWGGMLNESRALSAHRALVRHLPRAGAGAAAARAELPQPTRSGRPRPAAHQRMRLPERGRWLRCGASAASVPGPHRAGGRLSACRRRVGHVPGHALRADQAPRTGARRAPVRARRPQPRLDRARHASCSSAPSASSKRSRPPTTRCRSSPTSIAASSSSAP